MARVDYSVAGMILSLAIVAPNFFLLGGAPRAPRPIPRVPWALTVLERVGQAGCFVVPALLGGSAHVDLWLALVLLCVAAYYGLWGRYLLGGRPFLLLYAPLGPLPVPMAVLPVIAFLAAAAWWSSWPLAALATVLAIGHLSTAWIVARSMQAT